jgi:hypothetical protein
VHEINVSRGRADPGISQSDTEIERTQDRKEKVTKEVKKYKKAFLPRIKTSHTFDQERLKFIQLIFSGP